MMTAAMASPTWIWRSKAPKLENSGSQLFTEKSVPPVSSMRGAQSSFGSAAETRMVAEELQFTCCW
jgi:hypothetical protein